MAAAERIIPLFVLMVAFIATFILLVNAASNFVSSNIQANNPTAPNAEDFTADLITYDIFDPSIHTVITGEVHTHIFISVHPAYGTWVYAYPKIETFTPPVSAFGEHDVAMWCVRNNTAYQTTAFLADKNFEAFAYHDFLFFYQQWTTYAVLTHNRYAAVSYESIIDKTDPVTNISKNYIQLKHGYTVIVSPYGNHSMAHSLYLNHFNVTFASPKNESINSYGPWAMIGYVMTFSMPGVSPLVNLLIGLPFDSGVVFGIVELIRRFVPLLGG